MESLWSTTEPTGLDKELSPRKITTILTISVQGFTSLSVAADEVPTVQIAHFSVQEYLESDRIPNQKAMIFGLNSVRAHAEIAQICLIYLLDSELLKLSAKGGHCRGTPISGLCG